MKTDEITKIAQTNHPDKANELLSKGWKILKIFSTKTKYGDQETIEPCFVLGLFEK
jgi:hypothetical protein